MSNWEIFSGDCVEVMAMMPENSVDSIVTDPPYGLKFMSKEFDDLGEGAAQRLWHIGWAEQALRILTPGGYFLAFGSPRTYHHLASAVEEVGFEIRDSIQWIHSQGFPKSSNLGNGFGTALKPACEPIVMARKPFKGTGKKNYEANGTGYLNIDASRIGTEGPPSNRFVGGAKPFGDAVGEAYETTGPTSGRWPANVIFDEEAAATEEGIDVPTYFYCSKASKKEKNAGLIEDRANDRFRTRQCTQCDKNVPQAGSCGCPDAKIKWVDAKPTKNIHPTVKPIDLMRYLVRLVTPPSGLVIDPFVGSGTTGIAAVLEGFDFIGIEKDPEDEGYVELANQRIEHWVKAGGQ